MASPSEIKNNGSKITVGDSKILSSLWGMMERLASLETGISSQDRKCPNSRNGLNQYLVLT